MEARGGEALMSISLSLYQPPSTTAMLCFVPSSGYLFWLYGLLFWILTTLVFITEARNIIRCSVQEEVDIGSTVVNIMDESRLQQTYAASPEILDELYFSFLVESEWNFSIGAKSGILETNGRIDRESITQCPMQDICEVTIDVAVQPVQFFRIIKVIIEIIDINDNSPVFPELEVTHPILESALAGNSFAIPTAADLDSPLYGVMRYELESDDDTFGITQKEKLDGAFDLRINVQNSLDREIRPQYRVKITAFDGGNPSKSGSLSIIIPVMDSNDNSPVFDNMTYKVTVPENIAVGVSILRVHATDQDVGQNGRILYGFSPMSQGLYGNILAINQETGDVFIKGELDREEVSVCNLIVTARDQGPDSLPSDATVVVTITDINDNAPEITINTLGSSQPNKAQISEDVIVGTFVAHVSVTDPDEGQNGELNCSLNDYTFALEQTFKSEFQIVTGRPLDRETIPQYGLELVCRDKGHPPQVSIKRITIVLLDVNDNPPVFSKKSYITNIVENEFTGIGVEQTIATDRDLGRNGEVSYSLSGDISEVFEIDSHTGAIKTLVAIDREAVPKYHFQVMATDHGQPPKSAMAHIVVTVDDINDESPEFSQSKFAFYIPEDEPERSQAGKVYAVDRDSPPYNRFIYMFDESSNNLPFSIDTSSGYIVTRRPLDREEKSVYHMTVVASDQGSPPKSSTASVTVYVKDKNDNAPMFEFPNRRNSTVFISNKVPVGSKVTQITAHDPDTDNNAKVAYQILNGDTEGVFSILPDTGEIRIHLPVNSKDYASYQLTVEAKDHGTPRALKSEATLRIVVNSTIPYPPGQSAHKGTAFHYNVIVVVAVACGGAVITVSLIVGILLVRSQGRKRRVHKYNCRMEAKRMLTAKELQSSAPEESIPMKNGPQSDGGLEISKSLSQMDNHPCISGISPQTPVVQLHPKPWCTSASGVHRDHLVRGPRTNVSGHCVSDQDKTSDHSGDGSQTDSGRGASEEGEKHRIPHGLGHYGTHGHVKLPSSRRDGVHNNLPASSTIQLRTGNHIYPPPPPPPNRLRTFNPDGRVPKNTDHAPSSVVFPSGMADYATMKPVSHQSPASMHHVQPSNHNNLNHSSASTSSDDPWQQKGPVIGESVIV